MATLYCVLKGNKKKLEALSYLIPTLFIILFSIIWSRTMFFQKYPALVIVTVGLQFFIIVNKMIISTITKIPISRFQVEPFVLLLPVFNIFLHFNDWYVFGSTFVITAIFASIYVFGIVNQLADYLGIRVFKIVPKSE